MNLIFRLPLQCLCAVVFVGLLSACGASSTVDPFKPTRVVGLGDGYNDATATVDDGTSTRTVVGQMASHFAQSNVISKGSAGAKVANLSAQIDDVLANNGGFSSGDLVVIAVGTMDVKEGTQPDTAAQALLAQVQRLKAAGVKHTLVMPVLDLTRTPWGLANPGLISATATNNFNEAVLLAFNTAFGGQTPNTVIFANASGVSSFFLTATSLATYSPFSDTGFSGTLPACGSATSFAGCVAGAAGVNTNYPSMLFANGIHLTPAGNRWVAGYLYNATAQGWR